MTGILHIVVAMKPLEGTFAENALTHGVAGLNIDECRILTEEKLERVLGKTTESASGWKSVNRSAVAGKDGGRWPANILHDGSEEVREGFPETHARGNITPTKRRIKTEGWGNIGAAGEGDIFPGDSGSAARFFHEAGEITDIMGDGKEDTNEDG